MKFIRSLVSTLVVVAGLAIAPAHAAYTSVVAFGDSLSDNGNSLTPPSPTPRAADGDVAVKVIANTLGIPLVEYAVNGALSGTGNSDDPVGLANTGVLSQVNKFLQGPVDPLALYILSGGANDVLDALATIDLTNATEVDALVGGIIGNLTDAVGLLRAAHAANFLLPLLPDLGLTPAANQLGVSGDLSMLSALINDQLSQAYAVLMSTPEFQGASVVVFDTAAAQQAELLAFAAAGGNVTDACPTAFDPTPQCGNYFFWDPLHPSAAAHALLAADALAAAANGVPEPGTLALAGAALLFSLRRRRQA